MGRTLRRITRQAPKPTNRTKKKTKERIKKNMQRHRQKIKNNTKLYEDYKKKDRERKQRAKSEGKSKSINDMSEREKKQIRNWRKVYMREYRLKKKQKATVIDPGPNNNESEPLQVTSGNHGAQERRPTFSCKKRKNPNSRLKEENEKLKRKNDNLQKKVWRLEKRETRKRKKIPSPELTPRSKVTRLCEGRFVNPQIKRQLLKGFATEKELESARERVGNSIKYKKMFGYFLPGKVLKKYKLLSIYKGVLPLKSMRKTRKNSNKSSPLWRRIPGLVLQEAKNSVEEFLLSDRASHFTPGKKSFVKVNGEKVQKKYLNDTLQELHKIFLRVSANVVSFSTFCKYKPKNVVTPRLEERDTCLCKKCENFKMLVSAAIASKIIKENCHRELVKSVVCSEPKEECYFRNCSKCKGKKINFVCQRNSNTEFNYKEWATVKEKRVSAKTKSEIIVKVTQKVERKVTVKQAVTMLAVSLTEYMAHKQRSYHQFEEWNHLKENMTDEDLLAVFDWSEKYSARCSEEIQSTHFGGSHKLISLHTGMVYTTEKAETFCTLSECTEQGPKAILAHIKPILERNINKKTKYCHFKSDGPTTQYRSKFMFYLVGCELKKMFPQIKKVFWNFTEAGHGKSVADGTGGTIKRVLDSIIAHGGDIPDLQHIMTELSKKNLKTFVLDIYPEDVRQMDSIIYPNFERFNGTMKVHQYIWDRSKPQVIKFKTLSCYRCNKPCNHYSLGKPYQLPKPLNVSTRSSRRKKT